MDSSKYTQNYASFIAFSMDKVFESAKVTIRNIPGEVLPGSNLVMIYTSPLSGKSIYLENIQNTKKNKVFDNWVFTKDSQINGVEIFLNDLSNNIRTPIGNNIKHSLWENIPSLLNKYGQTVYIIIISIISATILYLIYKLFLKS